MTDLEFISTKFVKLTEMEKSIDPKKDPELLNKVKNLSDCLRLDVINLKNKDDLRKTEEEMERLEDMYQEYLGGQNEDNRY